MTPDRCAGSASVGVPDPHGGYGGDVRVGEQVGAPAIDQRTTADDAVLEARSVTMCAVWLSGTVARERLRVGPCALEIRSQAVSGMDVAGSNRRGQRAHVGHSAPPHGWRHLVPRSAATLVSW